MVEYPLGIIEYHWLSLNLIIWREIHVMPHWSKCLARWTLKYHFHWSISWFLEDTSQRRLINPLVWKKHYVVNSINPHESPVQIFVIIKYRQSILIPTKLNLSKSLLIMVVTRYNRISWSWLFNLLKYHHHQVSPALIIISPTIE